MIANEQRTIISEQTLAIDFNVQFKIATKMIDQNQFEVKQTNFDPYHHFDHLSSNRTNKLANSQQELNYLKYLLTQASLKFVIKIPKWWGIATPNGWYNPDWLVIEQNGQTKIIETKATLDQNQWRMSEKLKNWFCKASICTIRKCLSSW